MTPLRRKMIEDMTLADFAPSTQEAYVHAVRQLAAHYGCPPDLLQEDELRAYFLHMVNTRKLARSTVRQHLCGVKFFYETTLGRQWHIFELIKPKRGRTLPVVLSRDEVWRVIGTLRDRRFRLALTCAYCCGLRLGEIVGLRLSHIDGERMQIRVVAGKGRKDRNVPLPARLLSRLREYWLGEKPVDYLFPSHAHWRSGQPIHPNSLQKAVKAAVLEAEVGKRVTIHTFRHCYATHLLECGVDLRLIQQLLGHSSAQTTAIYAHLTEKSVDRLHRALDELTEAL